MKPEQEMIWATVYTQRFATEIQMKWYKPVFFKIYTVYVHVLLCSDVCAESLTE